MAEVSKEYYAGQNLGYPSSGPGSMATLGKRVVALFIDYTAASLIAAAFFGYRQFVVDQDALTQFMPLAVFAVMNIIFIPTIAGTPGHRIMKLRVMRADGQWTGFWRPIVRTLLLVLVIPVAIWDQDNRGLHDKIAGTSLIQT